MTEELIERLIEALDEQKKQNKNLLETNQGLFNLVRGLQSTLQASFGSTGTYATYAEKVSVMANKMAKMHVPEEVKAIVEHKHEVGTSGKTFLVACGLFFLLGLSFLLVSWYRFDRMETNWESYKKSELSAKQAKWCNDYVLFMRGTDSTKARAPNSHNEFISSHPYPD